MNIKLKILFLFFIQSSYCLALDIRQKNLDDLSYQSHDNVKASYIEASERRCNSVSYKISEIALNPNEAAYFYVPMELRTRSVALVSLGHRQNGQLPQGAWDNRPGLSSLQIHSKGFWNFWNGPASGKNGAKFAENRDRAELEYLYDWSSYGHVNVETRSINKNGLKPEAIKVVSIGKDPVLLSEVTLKVEPYKEIGSTESIYSKGTTFTLNDPIKKYTLGGGQAFRGKFPGAKVLQDGEMLKIPLEVGQRITGINVACGDTHPDEKINSDQGWGTQGWAKISMGIESADGSITWLTRNENVPPEGVMMASMKSCEERIEPGSKLVIKSSESTLYVMGVHIGYR